MIFDGSPLRSGEKIVVSYQFREILTPNQTYTSSLKKILKFDSAVSIYTYIFPKLPPHIGMGLFQELFSIQLIVLERKGGPGGVLPIMAYTGRLRPKVVPFSGFRYIKG